MAVAVDVRRDWQRGIEIVLLLPLIVLPECCHAVDSFPPVPAVFAVAVVMMQETSSDHTLVVVVAAAVAGWVFVAYHAVFHHLPAATALLVASDCHYPSEEADEISNWYCVAIVPPVTLIDEDRDRETIVDDAVVAVAVVELYHCEYYVAIVLRAISIDDSHDREMIVDDVAVADVAGGHHYHCHCHGDTLVHVPNWVISK